MSKALEKALAVLTSLGVDTDVIATLKGTDETKIEAIDPKEIHDYVVDNQKEILRNDEEFTKPIISETRRGLLQKRAELLLRLFKDYGITNEEYAALPDHEKFDSLMKLLKKKVDEKKAGSGDDKDQKIQELAAAIEQKEEEIRKLKEEEIPGIETKFKTEREKEITEGMLRSTFEKTLAGKTIVDPELVYPAIYTQLNSKYDVKSENGVIVLYDKGKTTKALKNSKPLKVEDAYLEIAEEKKALKKSEDPPKKDPLTDTPPKKFKTIGSSEFEKKLAEKEAAVKGNS